MAKSKPHAVENERQRELVLALIAGLNIEKAMARHGRAKNKQRTLSQNALYWKWVTEAVKAVHEHTGQDKDDIHEFFKRKFLTPKVVELAGEVAEYYTTRGLEIPEMKEYMDKIYAFCVSELGVLLPLPEEMHLR